MPEQVVRTKTVTSDGSMQETTRRFNDNVDEGAVAPVGAEPASFTAARVIWFIAGVIIALLALRFLLVLLGANQANAFVNLIYSLSYPFAAPFFGIFSYRTQYGISRFEISTLVAMLVYYLVAWGLARLTTIRHPQAPVA